MDILTKLISLYAKHGVEALEKGGEIFLEEFGVRTVDALEKIPNFNEANVKVKSFATSLQLRIKKCLGNQDMEAIGILKFALNKSLQDRNKSTFFQEMDIIERLVKESITYSRWDEYIKAHFNTLFPKICNWFTYFLSYTNQNSFFFNKKYQRILSRIIPLKEYDVINANLIAETTYILLKNHHGLVGGFYDKPKVDIGTSLNRIKQASAKSFVFIQINSRFSFTESEAEKNWCFVEFNSFKSSENQLISYGETLNDRYCFLIDGERFDDVRPAAPFPNYEEWIDFIPSRSFRALGKDFRTYDSNIRELARTVITIIEEKIISKIPRN